jgi:hypothetical protein
MQAAEARMRRALGLDGEQLRARPAQERVDSPQRPTDRFSTPGHKRRFVHDGEVPVTLVHGLVSSRRDHADGNGGARGGANAQPTNRLEVAEAALAAEIATRERAERISQEAQAAVHDLQTKLGHAELARQEAAEALRRERESAAALRASLHEVEAQLGEARQAQEVAERALAELRDRRAARAEEVRVARAEEVRLAQAEEVQAALSEEVQPALSEDVPAMYAEELVEVPPRPRRGRKPRVQILAAAEPVAATVAPRKGPGRPRKKELPPAREPKPIRWWLSPRTKKKR